MRNIKALMSYKGTAYHGFQRQENAVGIQNILEEKLSYLTDGDVKVNGCSRTDSGVHANEYCFSFKTEHSIPCSNLVRGMNSLLPDDIAIKSCEDVSDDFHARYSCIGKEYVYLILNSPTKNPFLSDRAFYYPYRLDVPLIEENAADFVGTHNFTSFCGIAGQKENSVRTVEYFRVEQSENLVKLIVKGDGFLYNMVRIMVGTLIYINEGRIQPGSIPAIIAAENRNLAGKTAVPYGLYLNRVYY
ncbi:MAG: tRNA pseudouridine(38-40) synthase TruA [Oscillospiraceae bacterium]|nr:tRNA pseudouridine(38-40) synthase TruA [Oscillospiraceae bacterium]